MYMWEGGGGGWEEEEGGIELKLLWFVISGTFLRHLVARGR